MSSAVPANPTAIAPTTSRGSRSRKYSQPRSANHSGIIAMRIAATPDGTCSDWPNTTKPLPTPSSRPPTMSESRSCRRVGTRRASGWRSRSKAMRISAGDCEPDGRHQERRHRLDGDRDAEVRRAPDDVDDGHVRPERGGARAAAGSGAWHSRLVQDRSLPHVCGTRRYPRRACTGSTRPSAGDASAPAITSRSRAPRQNLGRRRRRPGRDPRDGSRVGLPGAPGAHEGSPARRRRARRCTTSARSSRSSACAARCSSCRRRSPASSTPRPRSISRPASASACTRCSRARASRRTRRAGSPRSSGRRWTSSHELGEATAADLTKRVPGLREQISFGEGKKWAGQVGVSTRLLFLLAAEGRIIRGRPRGTWLSSLYRWVPMDRWVEGGLEPWPAGAGARRSSCATGCARSGRARSATSSGGPAGPSRGRRRRCAASDAVEVELEDGATGLGAAGRPRARRPSRRRGSRSCRRSTSTTMAWKERGLVPRTATDRDLFDTHGNAGPTVWVDGRVVGLWAQRSSMRGRLPAARGRRVASAARALDAEAARLTAWLGRTACSRASRTRSFQALARAPRRRPRPTPAGSGGTAGSRRSAPRRGSGR